jgi:signal peptidase I
LLSAVLPGLGQLYAGYPAAAMAGYAAVVTGSALLGALWLRGPEGPLPIFLGALAAVGAYLAVVAHAWALASRQPVEYGLRPYHRWYVYLGVYLLVSHGMGTLMERELKQRLEAFRVPSGSMAPTLLIGDYLQVVKTEAARRELAHGSIVVFESVEEPGLKVVKRIVGLPGDTLMMTDGTLYRNGRAQEETYAIHTSSGRTEDAEQRGRMRSWQVARAVSLDTASYAPDLQDWGPLVVPADSFFSLGDNRDASYDSRYYGFVPRDRVIGRPRVIYFSLARDSSGAATGVQWSRIGLRFR